MKKKAEQATLKPEAAARLRQAGDAGSGWYAAVARAAEAWEPKHRPTRPQPTKPEKTDAERLEAPGDFLLSCCVFGGRLLDGVQNWREALALRRARPC